MRSTLLFLTLGLTLVGCQPQDPLSQVVFVKADDIVITAKDAKDAAEFLAKAQECSGKPIKAERMARWINQTSARSFPSLLASALFEREFVKRGLVASDAAKKIVLARYRKTVRNSKASVDDIAQAFGEYGDYFRRQFDRECRMEQYLIDCEGIVPTDEDVEIAEAQLKQVAEKNDASDAKAKAKGEEAWNCLKRGEKWDVVAAKYSEDKLLYGDDCEYDKEWETIIPKQFYLPEIADALPGMKPDDFTKPIETDEGLIIVRVLGKSDTAYDCARILIRLKVKVDIPDRGTLKAQLEKENRAQAQLDLLNELRAQTKFEYPLGTNFKYKVVQEPVKANRKVKRNEDKK